MEKKNQPIIEEVPLKSLRSYLKAPKVRDFGALRIGDYIGQKEIEDASSIRK